MLSGQESIFASFTVTLDIIAQSLLWPVRVIFIVLPGAILQLVGTQIGSIGSEEGFLGINKFLTIDHILFNEVPVTDVNVFNFDSAGDSSISSDNVLYLIRQNVATWYYAIRNLAIALSLAVLVYIGIKMAISSIADDKAKYKKMFKDWFVSFALIFVLQYLMVFVIQLNEGIVDVLNGAKMSITEEMDANDSTDQTQNNTNKEMDNSEAGNIGDKILKEALLTVDFVRGLSISVIYLMLVAMTMLFLVLYIKRFITICFLILISPLITVTYAIDKSGDGRAQALNKWLKEFAFNILIQPFHCIIYMLFIQNIYEIIMTSEILHFGQIFVVIIMFGFMYKSEDIIKSIFGFETSNLGSAAALGALAISKVQNFGKGASNASSTLKAVKGIKTPSSLPGTTREIGGNKQNGIETKTNNSSSQSNAQTTNKTGKKVLKNMSKYIGKGSANTAKKLSGIIVSSALAYGLTGDYEQAEAAHGAAKGAKGKIDKARLNSKVKQRKEEMLDAMQSFQEKKGYSDYEMQQLGNKLLGADIDSITDEDERILAEFIQANKQTQKIIGAKDPNKVVQNQLKEFYE